MSWHFPVGVYIRECGLLEILTMHEVTLSKKQRAMHTKYGVLRLSHLEHFIWHEVTPKLWCVFYSKLGVLSHQLCAFALSSVFFPTPSSVFSH